MIIKDWLIIDETLILNAEDISTKADSHICRCYSTTNNQDIHSEILWQKDIDKYGINNNNNNTVREWVPKNTTRIYEARLEKVLGIGILSFS